MARSIVAAVVVWVVLYWAALHAIRWRLIAEAPDWWSAPVWIVAFALPAAVVVYGARVRWYLAGLGVGVCGSVVWTLHAGLVYQPLAALGQWIPNLMYACAGAGAIAGIRHRSNKSFKPTP